MVSMAEAAELEALRAKVEEHLARASGAATRVTTLRPLAGGACQDNMRVEATIGGESLALVLRSDARSSLPASLDRKAELSVIEAAVAAGVRTPRARWLARDLVRPGAHAYFMDWVDGEALGRRVVAHPSLEKARARLPRELVAELVKIHAIRSGPEIPRVEDPVAASLAALRQLVDRLPSPRPATELALAWLDENAPRDREVALVHGDFRTGNFLVGPEGLAAVLDWEFAHWGAPLEDLGWLCVRDWRFGRLDRAAGGIFRRDELLALYREATGREASARDLRFWEVFGNARWAAGSAFQGERALSAGEGEIELLAIARRTAEMEYEALRLMETT
jgi:aminoglycoside phosphotransferase (APT) family kinase protein